MNLALIDRLEVVPVEGDAREPFAAVSISKPVAALTALRLGMDLDEPVNALLRSWQLPQGDGVTLRRLLGHAAGLGLPFCPGSPAGEELPTLIEVLEGVHLETPPGSGFRYSGGGYALVQLLIEDVAGRSFAEVAETLVLEPLGMNGSTFAPGEGHRCAEQAAAGLTTTVADLARLLIAIQQGVCGATAMLTPHVDLPAEGEWTALRDLGVEPPVRAGLGLFLSDDWFSHLGGAHDSFSALWGSVDGRRGVVAQQRGGPTPEFFQRLADSTEGLPV